MIEVLVLLALGSPILGGLAAWRLDVRRATRVALAATALATIAALSLVWMAFDRGPIVAAGGVVRIDGLSAWLLLVVSAVVLLAIVASPRYLASELAEGHIRETDPGRYYALVLWFVASLLAAPLLDNLGLLWVAIETATGISALLVGFHRTPGALEAAWKYLILGSVGIGFALLGTLLLYASSVEHLGETSDALNWSRLMSSGGALDPGLVRLGFLFALVGYGTKIGLAPFHTWLPDAHSQAPSPVSAILSGVTLAVALYALIRFHLVADAALGPGFSATLLVAFGLLSIAVALPFLVAQGDLKRLLAYSSIEHMGLLTIAIGFGGPLALLGATVHLLAHGLTKAIAFITAGDLVQQYGSRRLGRLKGTLAAAPESGPGLLAATLLVGGLPPSAVFVAEFAILVGGVERGWTIAAAVAALLLALGLVAVAFHVVPMGWGERGRRVSIRPASPAMATLVAGPLGVVVVLGLWTPEPLARALAAVVAVLGGAHG
jgi:hydrogenase-4 component F